MGGGSVDTYRQLCSQREGEFRTSCPALRSARGANNSAASLQPRANSRRRALPYVLQPSAASAAAERVFQLFSFHGTAFPPGLRVPDPRATPRASPVREGPAACVHPPGKAEAAWRGAQRPPLSACVPLSTREGSGHRNGG